MSESVTGGLEEADQHHGPHKVQISHHSIFLWESVKLAFMLRKVKVKMVKFNLEQAMRVQKGLEV